MIARPLAVSLLSFALVTTATPRIGAQTPSAAPSNDPRIAQARALFEDGLRLVEAERWGEALEFFQRSRALVERPSTLFNVGSVLVRLGRMAEAISTLEQFLRLSDVRANAAERAEAQRLLSEASAAQGRLTLTLNVPDVEVSLDGVILTGTGPQRSFVVDPGAHRLRASARGYEDASAQVSVLPGAAQSLEFALAPRPSLLVLSIAPTQARVTLDRADRGTARRFDVHPGVHSIRVEADGYVSLDREAFVATGQTTSLDLTLARRPPSRITSSPWFWVVAGVVVVGATTAIVAATLSDQQPPYGGSTDTVLSAIRSAR